MAQRPSFDMIPAVLAIVASTANCRPPIGPLPPPTFRSVNGVVIGVDERTPSEQMAQGLRVRIQPEGRPLVVVDLAPGWYLDQQGLHFSERDRLSVEGTVSPSDPVLHAQRVRKGTVTVRLRDSEGRPFWDPAVVPPAD